MRWACRLQLMRGMERTDLCFCDSLKGLRGDALSFKMGGIEVVFDATHAVVLVSEFERPGYAAVLNT